MTENKRGHWRHENFSVGLGVFNLFCSRHNLRGSKYKYVIAYLYFRIWRAWRGLNLSSKLFFKGTGTLVEFYALVGCFCRVFVFKGQTQFTPSLVPHDIFSPLLICPARTHEEGINICQVDDKYSKHDFIFHAISSLLTIQSKRSYFQTCVYIVTMMYFTTWKDPVSTFYQIF